MNGTLCWARETEPNPFAVDRPEDYRGEFEVLGAVDFAAPLQGQNGGAPCIVIGANTTPGIPPDYKEVTKSCLTAASFRALTQTCGPLGRLWPMKGLSSHGQPWEVWVQKWCELKLAVDLWRNILSPTVGFEQAEKRLSQALEQATVHGVACYQHTGGPPVEDCFLEFVEPMLSRDCPEDPNSLYRAKDWSARTIFRPIPLADVRQEGRSEDEERREVACLMLEHLVNENLQSVRAVLQWTQKSTGAQSRPVRSERATDTLGHLWLHLYQAILGNEEYGECRNCGNQLKISGRAKGKGKLYCGTSCRTSACRQRAKEAQREGIEWRV